MKTEEHLELILTFCRSRLEMAARRTPGEWTNQPISMTGYTLLRAGEPWGSNSVSVQMKTGDAAFIAACAGAAEAGWRATIAAIEGLQQLAQTTVTWMAIHQHTLRAILAAYPLELITP